MKNINITQNNNKSYNQIFQKPISIMTEGYDHLIKSFDTISNSMLKFNEKIKSPTESNSKNNLENNLTKSFNSINKNFLKLKENFVEYYTNLQDSINKIDISSLNSKTAMMNLSNSSEDTNNNSNLSSLKNGNGNNNKLIPTKMKSNYDKIFNEFQKIEKTTKEMYSIKKEMEEKRKNRIKMLELKLQGFSEEIKNVNFDDIQKHLEDLTITGRGNIQINVMKSSNLLIENNKRKDKMNFNQNFVEINNDNFNENENYEDDDNYNHNILLNQILSLNNTKGDEMKNFIESLLIKTESEIGLNDTVQKVKK